MPFDACINWAPEWSRRLRYRRCVAWRNTSLREKEKRGRTMTLDSPGWKRQVRWFDTCIHFYSGTYVTDTWYYHITSYKNIALFHQNYISATLCWSLFAGRSRPANGDFAFFCGCVCGCVCGGVCVCLNERKVSHLRSHLAMQRVSSERHLAPTREAPGLPEHDQRAAISFFQWRSKSSIDV